MAKPAYTKRVTYPIPWSVNCLARFCNPSASTVRTELERIQKSESCSSKRENPTLGTYVGFVLEPKPPLGMTERGEMKKQAKSSHCYLRTKEQNWPQSLYRLRTITVEIAFPNGSPLVNEFIYFRSKKNILLVNYNNFLLS